MNENDEVEFNQRLDGLMLTYGRESNPKVFKFWFALMQEFTLKQCSGAMTQYAKTNKFPPVPAGVIELIPGSQGISADEAWAHIPKLETDSGWMNQRMAQAFGSARHLIDSDDMIAARMSFIAAYNNADDDNEWFYSRAQGVPFEVAEREKVAEYLLLEGRGWVKPSKNINQLKLEQDSNPALTETHKKRAVELVKLTNGLTGKLTE
ncbi:MAG: hypothetical protein KAT90_12135 [Gammaproteobacteria bacterium]|nr:hypothetical protein [Gammaproteobacteria bacterium]